MSETNEYLSELLAGTTADMQRITDERTAIESLTIDQLAETLLLLEGQRKATAGFKAFIEQTLVAATTEIADDNGKRTVTIPGWEVQIGRQPGSVKTDWPLLLSRALTIFSEMRSPDADTGEIETLESVIERQLPKLVPLSPSIKPKVSGLEGLGLDRGYCQETGDWRYRVRLTETAPTQPDDTKDK